MTLSADGNSLLHIQNPSFNNIITAPQNLVRTTAAPQQLQPIQKTIFTSNGQQYVIQSANGGGQLNLINQLPYNSFVVQSPSAINIPQNQQIINPIVIQSPNQQLISQQQILTENNPNQTTSQGSILTAQQAAQFISHQNENNKIQSKMIKMQHHKSTQQQKSFFPQIIKNPRTVYATSTKNSSIPVISQSIIEQQHNFTLEEDDSEESEGINEQDEELDEICDDELEQEDFELTFVDKPPDMIEELHHGNSQQILHNGHIIDGSQYGIMNIDDIKIEMDEINDLNEYLNAIDEEDNRMSQMGLSSLQNFSNSPPDTTTHSPRSPTADLLNGNHLHHIIASGSDKSNGSSENNMVSSSELDSSGIPSDYHQHHLMDSAQSSAQNYSININNGM